MKSLIGKLTEEEARELVSGMCSVHNWRHLAMMVYVLEEAIEDLEKQVNELKNN